MVKFGYIKLFFAYFWFMNRLSEKNGMAKKNRSINLDEEVWKKLEALALEQNRSLNNYLETVILKVIKEEEANRRKKI